VIYYLITGEVILLVALYHNTKWDNLRKVPVVPIFIASAAFIVLWPIWLLALAMKEKRQ